MRYFCSGFGISQANAGSVGFDDFFLANVLDIQSFFTIPQ